MSDPQGRAAHKFLSLGIYLSRNWGLGRGREYDRQGCTLKKFIFLPPPFLIYIFSPTEINYNEGVRAAGEKFSAFFCNFVYF